MSIFTNTDEWMAEHSYINCHAHGVDSIIFSDTPGQKLRLFVAHSWHELWKNRIPLNGPMSVALHSHHCDVRLIPLQGLIYNVGLSSAGWLHNLNRFRYQSHITGGETKFTPESECSCELEMELLTQPRTLLAEQQHTIFVEYDKEAAWFVQELGKDPYYESICLSNADLEHADFSRLYQPMTEAYMRDCLRKLGLVREG